MNSATLTLPETLKQARGAKRLSQLELALRVGVSQRHVSFVESGRARPSRELLMAWLQELQAPLAVRNVAMLQAGYAPAFGTAALDGPGMAQVNAALLHLVQAHDPLPAIIIDSGWNLVHMNRGAKWLMTTLVPWTAELIASGPGGNMLDLLVHPQGLANHIVNLEEVGPAFLAQLRDEAAVQPALIARVHTVENVLHTRIGPKALNVQWSQTSSPVLTTRYASPFGELSFFSMFTTFGSPQNITLASLRVEHMFAADDATRAVIDKGVG